LLLVPPRIYDVSFYHLMALSLKFSLVPFAVLKSGRRLLEGPVFPPAMETVPGFFSFFFFFRCPTRYSLPFFSCPVRILFVMVPWDEVALRPPFSFPFPFSPSFVHPPRSRPPPLFLLCLYVVGLVIWDVNPLITSFPFVLLNLLWSPFVPFLLRVRFLAGNKSLFFVKATFDFLACHFFPLSLLVFFVLSVVFAAFRCLCRKF